MGERIRATLVLAFTALVVASCSDGSPSARQPPPTTSESDTSVPARRNVDGVLKIGVWLPATGAVAGLGRSLQSGVELAVKQINDTAGVNGRMVEYVPRDEGSDVATAYQALTQLLEVDQVDAIIGPASSRVALGALDLLADARVITCSPAATATALDQRVDDGYFVRTIGSEALEAVALTAAMTRTGSSKFAVLFPDDDYGHDFADRMQAAFSRRREAVQMVPYEPTAAQYNLPAGQALAGGTEVLGVVGSGPAGARVLAALARNGGTPDRIPTFVTSGLRRRDLAGLIDPRQPMASAGIWGVSPLAEPRDPSFLDQFTATWPNTPVDYAAYAYDCANLVALAAEAAGSDDPEQIRSQLPGVSEGGSPCSGFAECAMALGRGQNIDLDGASGDLDLQDDGDVSDAWYDLFQYNDAGEDISLRLPIAARVDLG
jgi:ABC-type branched-subunit amino acid transport system substrate-binding protein